MYNVTISIDDLHPEQGWGCEGDESVGYLEELNKEFGCKFNLFIPSNYHGKYPLSKHKDWVDFWLNKDWVELSAHGHYHQCKRTDIGECEFFELDYQGAIEDFSSAIEIDSKYKEAYIGRGKSKVKLENYKSAIKDYSRVIKLDPNDKLALRCRSTAYKLLSDIDLTNLE